MFSRTLTTEWGFSAGEVLNGSAACNRLSWVCAHHEMTSVLHWPLKTSPRLQRALPVLPGPWKWFPIRRAGELWQYGPPSEQGHAARALLHPWARGPWGWYQSLLGWYWPCGWAISSIILLHTAGPGTVTAGPGQRVVLAALQKERIGFLVLTVFLTAREWKWQCDALVRAEDPPSARAGVPEGGKGTGLSLVLSLAITLA